MSLAALALVLTAAFCHAGWNFLVKKINGGPELVWLFSAVSITLYAPVVAAVVWIERPVFGLTEWGFMVGSAMLHLAYFLLLQQGYKRGDLSLVYPTARATGPVLSASFAVLFLGEVITAQTAVGGIIIVLGVLFLTTGGKKKGATEDAATRPLASLAFGLGTGVFIGAYTVWDAHAVAVLMISPIILDYATGVIRAVVLAPVAYRRRDAVRAHWRDHRGLVIGIAILIPAAYILVLYALTFTSVVYVAPARETSVLISVLLGSLLLGEGDLPRRLTWASVIMAGVILLTTG